MAISVQISVVTVDILRSYDLRARPGCAKGTIEGTGVLEVGRGVGGGTLGMGVGMTESVGSAEGSGVATNFSPSMTSETPTDSVVTSRMAAKDAHFAGFSYNSTSAGP